MSVYFQTLELDEKCLNCYYINRTDGIIRIMDDSVKHNLNYTTKDGERMILKIDFESEEALYIQLCNQIIMGIATDMLHEGDSLPSVRQLADEIGINMHTVNKAYAVLRQEGFLRLDRRRGAVVALDMDKLRAYAEMKESLARIIARAVCKDIGRDEAHILVDQIYDEFCGMC